MELKRFYIKAAIIVIITVAASMLLKVDGLPLGVAVGGLLAIANIRGLVKGLKGMLGTEQPARRLFFASTFRLAGLFMIITAIAMLNVLNLMGLLAGFAVVSMALMLEAARGIRENKYDTAGLKEG